MGTKRGKLVVISGPSGAGKTSVCRALKQDPGVEFSISATTRAMRPKEVNGVDYHFLDEAEFHRRRAAGEFLESASYNGNYYGTLRQPMLDALAAGKVFILEIVSRKNSENNSNQLPATPPPRPRTMFRRPRARARGFRWGGWRSFGLRRRFRRP